VALGETSNADRFMIYLDYNFIYINAFQHIGVSKRTREPKQPSVESEYSPHFRRFVASGIWGVITPVGIDATIFSEQILVDDVAKSPKLDRGTLKVKRTVEFGMIINPLQMKAIHSWLGTKIEEYEHVFGKILSQEELAKRAKSLPISKKTSESKQ
jgi:hypothetical protein